MTTRSTPSIGSSAPLTVVGGSPRAPAVPLAALTEARLWHWIAHALPGHSILYHEGLLMRDRAKLGSALPAKSCVRLDAVATLAWLACELGLVQLFSSKVAEYHYRYVAVRTRTPLPSSDLRALLRQTSAHQLKEVA